MDEIDINILEILQEDCRTPFSTIAKQLGIAESTVRYRVDRLRKNGVITRFIALLNPRRIGLEITALALIKVDAMRLNEASEEIASFDETHHLFQSTGMYDLISVINARNIHHLNELIKKIKNIPGVKEANVEVATNLIKVEPRFNVRI